MTVALPALLRRFPTLRLDVPAEEVPLRTDMNIYGCTGCRSPGTRADPVDVHVDRARCLGAGMCALTAPHVFDQDEEEGLVVLLNARPPQERHAAVRVAAGVCPASVITLTEHGSSPAS